MTIKSTETLQNVIARLRTEIELEKEFTSGIKSAAARKQFAKVQKALIDLNSELDVLNTMKEALRGGE